MATLVVLYPSEPSGSVSGQPSSQTPDQPLRGSISRAPSLQTPQPRTQNPLTAPPPQCSNVQPNLIPTLSFSTLPYRASRPSAGSVSNATTQPNSHGPPSPLINPNHTMTTVLLDPYRGPLPLLRYTKKPAIYVYPYAPVSQSHYDRAPAIINIFRENVYKSKVKIAKNKLLREQGHLIDYGVKMCGPSAQESQPSILVICTKEVLPALKSLLTEDHIRFQYSRGALSPIKKMVANVLKQPGHTAEDSHMPRFNLYFWPDPRKPRTNLWSTTVRTSLNPSPFSYTSQAVVFSDLTMCGSLVHPLSNDSNSSSKFSTLGCLIQVKSDLHGLTAAHTFIAQPKHVSDEKLDVPEAIGTCFEGWSTETETAESMDDGPIIDYDEDYDLSSDSEIDTLDMDERGYPLVVSHDRGGGSEPLLSQELAGKIKAATVESVVVIPGKEDCAPDELDRDWALVEIQHPQYKLPNAYVVNQSSPQLAFFSTIASQHPREARQVHIISASPLTKNGILLPGSSYLGGLSGRGPCEVWNVTMSGSDTLSEGDSGSLVVDAVTHVVYGHVVASNPLGEIYVVPLSAVVKQIQAVFQTKDVQLPDPLPLLTSLAVSCVQSEQYAQGRAAFTALCELVQSMCCPEKWSSLFSWATSATRNALLDLPDHQLAKLFPESRRLEDMRKPLMLRHYERGLLSRSLTPVVETPQPLSPLPQQTIAELPVKTEKKYPQSWGTRVIFVPRRAQQFAYDPDSTGYKRCQSRNLQQNLDFSGRDGASFANAIEAVFKGVLRGRPWMPLIGCRPEDDPFSRMVLQQLPSDLCIKDVWNYPFLEDYCIAYDKMQGNVLYIALQHEDLSWYDIRFLPPILGSDESCWQHDEELDGSASFKSLDPELMYNYQNPPPYSSHTYLSIDGVPSKLDVLADSASMLSRVERQPTNYSERSSLRSFETEGSDDEHRDKKLKLRPKQSMPTPNGSSSISFAPAVYVAGRSKRKMPVREKGPKEPLRFSVTNVTKWRPNILHPHNDKEKAEAAQ